MKKAILFLGCVLISTGFMLAQQDVFKKYGHKKEMLTLSKGKYQEVFKNEEVVQIGTVLLNTKTNKVLQLLQEDTTKTNYNAELSSRFLTVDPLAEKYYNISPYAFCANNPIKFIDPNGMDIYRYDDKSGEMTLHQKNDDKTDQIGKFKYNKKSGEYDLKTNKKGEAKTRIDGIEKGILSDGMNFKTESNLIQVGGENQASVAGVENFAIEFSEMIGKELSGYYLADKKTDNINYVHIGKHENNKWDTSYKGYNPHRTYPSIINNVYEHTDWHTHPATASDSDRTRPSGQDINSRNATQTNHPQVKMFIILTKGYSPIKY